MPPPTSAVWGSTFKTPPGKWDSNTCRDHGCTFRRLRGAAEVLRTPNGHAITGHLWSHVSQRLYVS